MGIADNLKRLRQREGLSQVALAKKAGVSQQLISQLERGENLTTKMLPKIIRALNASIVEVDEQLARELAGIDGGDLTYVKDGTRSSYEVAGRPLEFAGIVKAGEFRPVEEYFTQDGVEVPAFVHAHPQFRRARQYAWLVEGTSMDAAGIEPGMWVVGVDYADYTDQYGEVESGEYVVVERQRFQGAEREITVKEVRFYRDRYELHPHSRDPVHLPIVVKNDTEVDGHDVTVRIIAKVLAAYRDFSQPIKP